MLFNSLEFALFLPIVFAIYWSLNCFHLNWQNGFLLLASYFFYGWWDWRFLGLIVLSTLVDYGCARAIQHRYDTEADESHSIQGWNKKLFTPKFFMYASLVANLGILGYFKYFNFFAESLQDIASMVGYELSYTTKNIVLPVGISFYTLQTLSYTIDVYRKDFKATSNLLHFSTYVCFFPQLVAGPIERAKDLLPQIKIKRVFDYNDAVNGLQLILWGLFKKVIIADSCDTYVNRIFNNYLEMNGITLIFGSLLFSVQLYCDFSGYSMIAKGLSQLFGINIQTNFKYPLFSVGFKEFWRRWHISLMSWVRDYIYIPLGGLNRNLLQNFLLLFFCFFLSALWHGASYNFLFWGIFNFIVLVIWSSIEKTIKIKTLSFYVYMGKILLLNVLFGLSLIFVKTESFEVSITVFQKIFFEMGVTLIHRPRNLVIVIISFIVLEYLTQKSDHPFGHKFFKSYKSVGRIVYFTFTIWIILYSELGEKIPFYYFQF